jgi:hypothetical protein
VLPIIGGWYDAAIGRTRPGIRITSRRTRPVLPIIGGWYDAAIADGPDPG